MGVLFCGGRGTRLGEITRYISKSFVPIYDKPVFKYGLDQLTASRYIDELVILTNGDNDEKLKQAGFRTVIQDDDVVFDMFSGWDYIKKVTGTSKHGVLMPSDNISDIEVDGLIDLFFEKQVDLVFSLLKVEKNKLAQMGCYDPEAKQFYYKHPNPPTPFGVIAPYIVRNSLQAKAGSDKGDNILNHQPAAQKEHNGFWFDIGDCQSIIEAAAFMAAV